MKEVVVVEPNEDAWIAKHYPSGEDAIGPDPLTAVGLVMVRAEYEPTVGGHLDPDELPVGEIELDEASFERVLKSLHDPKEPSPELLKIVARASGEPIRHASLKVLVGNAGTEPAVGKIMVTTFLRKLPGSTTLHVLGHHGARAHALLTRADARELGLALLAASVEPDPEGV